MNGISFARVKQPTDPEPFTPRSAPAMHQAVSTPAPAPLTAKQRRARRKKQIIYGSIGLLLLCIVASIFWSKREKPIPVTTEKAIRKTIVQTVSATGKVQPETEVKISPEVAGEVIDLPGDEGCGPPSFPPARNAAFCRPMLTRSGLCPNLTKKT